MQEEYWQNYSVAPVFVWVAPSDLEETCKKFCEKSIFIPCDEEGQVVASVTMAIDEAQAKILKVVDEEIKPAFAKVDKDGSGAIDKSELGELSAGLGQSLNEEQLEKALKDLDLNGDGVIDQSEF